MNYIITGDWHLDSDPKHKYRWEALRELMMKIRELYKQIYDNYRLIILGDLTEKKDKHDADLVNRLMKFLNSLTDYCKIDIVMGNHDFVDPTKPFFKFVNEHDRINFYDYFKRDDMNIFIPYHGEEESWMAGDYVFMHEDFKEAVYDDGQQSRSNRSIKSLSLRNFKHVFSGHVHRPQVIGDKFTYVGSPYPINFHQEDWDYSFIVIKDGLIKNEYLKYPKRITINIRSLTQVEDIDLNVGDHAKFIVNVLPSTFQKYPEIKRAIKDKCIEKGIIFYGCRMNKIEVKKQEVKKERINEYPDIIKDFGKREGLKKETIDIALELTKEK